MIFASFTQEKTRGLCHYYMGLTSADKLSFLRVLAIDYGVDKRVVQQLLAQVTNTLVSWCCCFLVLKSRDQSRDLSRLRVVWYSNNKTE
jgi:hypothetical protein